MGNKLGINFGFLIWMLFHIGMSAQSDTMSYVSKIIELKCGERKWSYDSQIFNPEKQPFFCRLENKGNRLNQISLKFRLGTVQYVDKQEYAYLLGRIY